MTDSRRFWTVRAFAIAVFAGIASHAHSDALGLDRLPPRAEAPISIEGAFFDLPRRLAAAPAHLSDLAFAAGRLTALERHELPALTSQERRELARSEKGRAKV